ncbi:MAG: S8 family serine peptidase [Bacteroidales bacterium]|nr:S8 family serine peptidase [Bacteroidales bacterium]
MKKSILLTALLTLSAMAMAQGRTLQPLPMQVAPVETQGQANGLSATSAFLLLDLTKGNLSTSELARRYNLVSTAHGPAVNAYVQLASGTDASLLKAYGVEVKRTLGGMHTVLVPIDRFVALATSGVCSTIDIGVTVRPTMDLARTATGVNALYAGTGYSQRYDGSGVVVGIIDAGFEYAHTAFYDSTGTTLRVKRVWNQRTSSGTAPSGYNYGAEYTTASAIIAAQTDATDETHGTHVAGIAAGCGGSNATAKVYRGVAPAADIVLVATTMTDAGVFDGIQYIMDYAQSVNKPCVINMSLGSHAGPHDGTSEFDRYCDTLLAGTQGVVLVGAAGNEGDSRLHLQKTFTATDTLLYSILDFGGSNYGSTIIDIWGEPGKNYMAGLSIIDTSDGTFAASSYFYLSNANSYDSDTLAGAVAFMVYQSGTDPYNNRQNISFSIDADALQNYSSVYRVILVVKSTEAQTLHAWTTNDGTSFINCNFTAVTPGNTDYTVGELGGSGNSMLSVGSYVTRNEWTAANSYHYTINHTVGALSEFSSHGPTLDGRTKPDVIAPGEYIVAPVNRFNTAYYNGTPFGFASTTIGGVTEHYAAMQGTSMASPFVTGVVALWLQHDPTLSHTAVKALAHSTALSDSHTGSIPASGSNLYGWGKINAAGAIQSANPNPDPTPGPLDTNTCVITSFPYTENFDGNINCWDIYDPDNDATNDGNNAWFFFNSVGVDNSACAGISNTRSTNYNNDYLISPAILAPGTYTVSWKVRCYQAQMLYYALLPDGSTTPYLLDSINSTQWQDRSYNFTVAQGDTVLVAFVYMTLGGSYLLIDDVTISTYTAPPAPTQYTLTVTSANPSMGTVSGGGTYVEGSSATLTATPGSGYRFVRWNDNNTANPRTVTVTANATYTAYFEAIPPTQYTLTVTSADPAMGTVLGGGTYVEGATVTLTANPNSGYRFVRWNDNNTANPRSVTVTANATYTAYFETEVSIADLQADGIQIALQGTLLSLHGTAGEAVAVTDLVGRSLYSGTASAATLTLPLPAAGVYFVRIGDRTPVKIVAVR